MAVRLARVLLASGRLASFENPPDLGEEGRPWHWPAMAGIACLWVTRPIRELRMEFGLRAATAPMCVFGSEYLKYFTILAPPEMQADLDWLGRQRCPATGAHARHTPARGRNAAGVSHAGLAGRYPSRLNVWLLRVLTAGRLAAEGPCADAASGSQRGSGPLPPRPTPRAPPRSRRGAPPPRWLLRLPA